MARLGWAVFVITLATNARGEDVVRFRVDYHAPAECPDARAFTAGITGRTERARIARGEDAARVEVTIESASGNEGRVRITGPGREPIERSVRGAGCNEIVDALALITALAFDPEASSESRPEPAPAPAPVQKPIAPAAPVVDESLHWAFAGALGIVALDSSLPGSGFGFQANAGADSEGALFAPKLFAFGRRVSGDTTKGGGRAEFSITSFGLVGCPLRVPDAGVFSFRPCVGFELGALSAEGVGLLVEKRETELWSAPIVSVRGEWRFATGFFAAGSAAARFPLQREHYSFESGEKVHDIPRISFDLGLEVGVLLD